MADKRMFAKSIVLSDIFLDMPMSARCLYFTLGMLADDDGFIGNVKSIMRQCGATSDDLNILLAKRYLLSFENGIIVIKHWRINNFLRSDRYKETTYIEEKSKLFIDEKGAYTDHKKTIGIPSMGKPSIDKNSIDKISKEYIGLDDNVVSSLIEFEQMRKAMKKPMTSKARTLLANKLKELSNDPNEQIKILEQSILNNWLSVYPLKNKKEDIKPKYEMDF